MGVHFMCGCTMEKREDIINNPNTFDTVKIDKDGYPICTIHNARPYGWRDPGYVKMRAGDGESFRVFDQVQAREEANVPPIVYPPLEVHRNMLVKPLDNRDPQEVGAKILATRTPKETGTAKKGNSVSESGNKGTKGSKRTSEE